MTKGKQYSWPSELDRDITPSGHLYIYSFIYVFTDFFDVLRWIEEYLTDLTLASIMYGGWEQSNTEENHDHLQAAPSHLSRTLCDRRG